MANDKPLTIPNLIEAMKEAGFATQSDLTRQREEITKDILSMREEIRDDGLNTLAEFYASEIKPEFEKVQHEMQGIKVRLENVEDEIREVKTELSWVKSEIKDLKADLSDTPSRAEFEELKAQVARMRPTN